MDLNQFILALRARRKAFVMVAGAVIVAALAIALVLPKKYVSSTTILLDARDEQQLTPTARATARERAGYLQTQIDLIQSTKVAKRVVRDLKYTQQPGMREQYERDTGGLGTIEDWAAGTLLRNVKADSSGSNIITVQYTDSSPKLAADVANGFAKAYVETSLELRTEPTREAAAWFEDQLKSLRTNVSQAQQKLTAYQKDKGITSTDERTDVEGLRLNELSTQLLAARNATYDAQSRYKHAAEFLGGSSSTGASRGSTKDMVAMADSLPEVMASPAVQAVKAALVAAEARLETSAPELGPNHPAYQRNVAEVQGLREKLASEMKKVVAGLNNSAVQARRREEELKNAFQAQQERLLTMRDSRVELAVMVRDLENAQRTYDTALSRWLTNKVESRANLTNIAVLTPAIEPLEAKSPKVPLIAGLAVLVGLLLAGVVVFLLETLDRRVRSRGDLESRLAVPSLGRLSKWQPLGARLLPAPVLSGARSGRALPHPW
jgi:succinoglycan biosynthesis transport protein ExoP